ncbi:MAG: DUF3237 domain-containing protein [Alphaproteobacteria bacterium]|nr:DUF3237 domain-containing protein [Alphaproteobacteria bacterium]
MSATIPATLEHIGDAAIKVASPLEIGDVGTGERRIIAIDGGIFSGPRLQGDVLPGGADFQLIRPNGFTILEARYPLRTKDGAMIYIENNGVRFGAPDVIAKLKRGEPVDPALVYFRSVIRFETSAPHYRWLMESIFVCAGQRRPDAVELSVFRLA